MPRSELTFVQEGATTSRGAAVGRQVSQELAKAGTKAAAATALASVGASAAIGTPVSVTLTAGLLGAAGASSTVPFAGWIAAGALVTAAGVTAIVSKSATLGRKLALIYAEKHFGPEGLAFAKEYANASQKDTAKIQSRIISLQSSITRLQGRQRLSVRRLVRIGRLKDKLNANLVILEQRAYVPEAVPIAGEPETLPVVVEQRAQETQATRESYLLPVVLVGGSALLIGAVLLWRRSE